CDPRVSAVVGLPVAVRQAAYSRARIFPLASRPDNPAAGRSATVHSARRARASATLVHSDRGVLQAGDAVSVTASPTTKQVSRITVLLFQFRSGTMSQLWVVENSPAPSSATSADQRDNANVQRLPISSGETRQVVDLLDKQAVALVCIGEK